VSDLDILANVWLFSGMDKERRDRLATFTFTRSYKQDDVIVEEGRTGNGLYVITSGRVEVVKAFKTENARRLATLSSGDFFGEMALLDEWPRSATVRALEATTCVGIDRWLLLAQLRKDSELAIVMLQGSSSRSCARTRSSPSSCSRPWRAASGKPMPGWPSNLIQLFRHACLGDACGKPSQRLPYPHQLSRRAGVRFENGAIR